MGAEAPLPSAEMLPKPLESFLKDGPTANTLIFPNPHKGGRAIKQCSNNPITLIIKIKFLWTDLRPNILNGMRILNLNHKNFTPLFRNSFEFRRLQNVWVLKEGGKDATIYLPKPIRTSISSSLTHLTLWW